MARLGLPCAYIFVSYSRAHGALVAPLVKLLKLDNRKVFLDEMSISPGDKWEAVLLDALSEAKIVVVLWCSHAKRSPWVNREWELAAKLKKSIIPVLLDSTSLPQELGKFQAINFSSIHPCVGLLAKIKRRFIQLFFVTLLLVICSYLSYSVRPHMHVFPAPLGDAPDENTHFMLVDTTVVVYLLLFFILLVSLLVRWRLKRRRVTVMGKNLAKTVMAQISPDGAVKWGSLNR